jgi:hypothetical protein
MVCNTYKANEREIDKLLKTHFYFVKTYRFLNAGDDNRSVMAYAAVKQREPWTYSYSLEAVINFERKKPWLSTTLLEAIGTKDDISSPHLRQLAAQIIKNQTHRTTGNQRGALV